MKQTTCPTCNGQDIFLLDTYKRYWHCCRTCGTAVSEQKGGYPLSMLPFSDLKKGAELDEEAPPTMIVDYVPCGACQEKLKKENATLLVDTIDNGERITGRVMVVKDQGYRDMFEKEPPEHKVALLHKEHFDQIFGWFKELEQEEAVAK